MHLIPKRFIGEGITVEFDQAPATRKNPHCPDRIIWHTQVYVIDELLEERRDHARRGRMTRNMRPAHQARAAQRGSWGVGRILFRVRTQDCRFFDLYYDRSPQGGNPLGQWSLYQELEPA